MHALKINSTTASPEYVLTFFASLKDHGIRIMLDRVRVAREAILDECHIQELDQAVQASFDGGGDVRALLRKREADLIAELDAARREKMKLQDKREARRAEVGAIVNDASAQSIALPGEIAELERLVHQYETRRDEARERYEAAGLSEADIETIGLKPNATDLAVWRGGIALRRDRLRRVKAFLADAPLYRTDILGNE